MLVFEMKWWWGDSRLDGWIGMKNSTNGPSKSMVVGLIYRGAMRENFEKEVVTDQRKIRLYLEG